MSDDQVVIVSQFAWLNPEADGKVPYGSVPLGGGEDFEAAPERHSFESFQPDTEPYKSFDDLAGKRSAASKPKRGRPAKK
jgi:hypothetical protein